MHAAPIPSLQVDIETWPLARPFRITGRVVTEMKLVVATLSAGGASGRGEAAGVYYANETAETVAAQLQAFGPRLPAGIDRQSLQRLLPAGGARNALDCAFWELESRLSERPVWVLAGLRPSKPLVTYFTIGAAAPDVMARAAAGISHAAAIKLKLLGDGRDADRVIAVREARPSVQLAVDGNQGFDRNGLIALLPYLERAGVKVIEQPFPVGRDETIRHLPRNIPFAADESVQTVSDLPRLKRIYDIVNIKLDKTGGLTAALDLARTARASGFSLMVGNMIGTSLAMAPACLVGQLCDLADLDGPTLLAHDRVPEVIYRNGTIECPVGVWG